MKNMCDISLKQKSCSNIVLHLHQGSVSCGLQPISATHCRIWWNPVNVKNSRERGSCSRVPCRGWGQSVYLWKIWRYSGKNINFFLRVTRCHLLLWFVERSEKFDYWPSGKCFWQNNFLKARLQTMLALCLIWQFHRDLWTSMYSLILYMGRGSIESGWWSLFCNMIMSCKTSSCDT